MESIFPVLPQFRPILAQQRHDDKHHAQRHAVAPVQLKRLAAADEFRHHAANNLAQDHRAQGETNGENPQAQKFFCPGQSKGRTCGQFVPKVTFRKFCSDRLTNTDDHGACHQRILTIPMAQPTAPITQQMWTIVLSAFPILERV